MFEESSSDEDESKSAKNTAVPNDDGKNVEDDNDKKKLSSSNDDDGDGGSDRKIDGSEEKKTAATSGLFDDSSDDDDAVFDDAGAVVGSSAPPSAKKKNGSGKTSDLHDDDNYNNSSTQNKIGERTTRIQNVTVLQADRTEEGTSLHMTKLPNVVAIQPTAFDETKYDEKEEEEQYKGYMHNMIRWRYKRDENGDLVRDGEDDSLVRESNTKLVKWSDGSLTLHIGKEAFDIQNVDSSTSNGFAGLNGYAYLSQKATFQNDNDDDEEELQNGKNGGTVLECIGPVASRLVAKPSSLQSESHKSLTIAVRQRTVKRAKIAQYMTEEDPEKLKQERIKYNEDADKLKQRKRASGGNYRSSHERRRPGMNRSYLEASDDEGYDTTNIRALKKGSASNYDMDEMDDYGDESDDDYDQSFVNRNRKRQRKSAEEESDDDEEMVFDDDDEEVVNIHKKKKSAAVLDDDE